MKEIREELFNASKLYKSENYSQALEIFEKHHKSHPEVFNNLQKTRYAWAIYRVHVQDFKSDDELLSAVERIADLTGQKRMGKNSVCIYSISVLKVLRRLKNDNDFPGMIKWIEMLDADLLDDEKSEFKGKTRPSSREFYYECASKAYYLSYDFESCIEVSKRALDSIDSFTNHGDAWHNRRIAQSLEELGRPVEALDYLKAAAEIRPEWYIFKEIAEIYHRLGKPNEALKYLCPAILSRKPLDIKVNLYYLAYQVLSSIRSPLAMPHVELYYLLKLESGAKIMEDVERLQIDESRLDKRQLSDEITEMWIKYSHKDQKQSRGSVISFNHERNYGFIRMEDGSTVFFHKSEFMGKIVNVGDEVSFFTEKSFDKTKNTESIKAVHVRCV